MDDQRIRKLTSEVLTALRPEQGGLPSRPGPLEERVAALEAEVTELKRRMGVSGERGAVPSAPASVSVSVHPSLQVLNLGTSPTRCVLEPDKPCSESGQCKSLGY